MAARWAADQLSALTEADPTMPHGFVNRAADNWRPLLAVADAANGGWPARAREAAARLSADDDDSQHAGALLLSDLRDAFTQRNTAVLFTAEILGVLAKIDERPWPEFRNGNAITARQVAALLKPYGIKPKTVRRDTTTEKGYRREWFDDAFARYLPPPARHSVTTEQLRGFEGI
jgi:hypothetical protein